MVTQNEKVVPFLNVKDIQASEDFYCGKLGFTKEWVYQPYQGPPRNLCVTLGTAKLYLSEFEESGAEIKLVIWFDDLTAIKDRCDANDVDAEFHEQGHFGTRELQFKDVDEHYLLFCERPEDGP